MEATVIGREVVSAAELGEQLGGLRLRDASALAAMSRSLGLYGQLEPIVVFAAREGLEVLDGFKRLHAARRLGWTELWARRCEVAIVEAKIQIVALHERRGLSELEEAWLVRSLYRDDGLCQPEIARRLNRHKSWVCRRLMLVEALEPAVQAQVRLGLLSPRAAVALGRLPRGNQEAAGAVVARRGLTVRQTELLVEELLACGPEARAALCERRLEGPVAMAKGPAAARIRSEADWMSADVIKLRTLCARLETRLLATPLATLPPGASELLSDALVSLVPALRALGDAIAAATGQEAA